MAHILIIDDEGLVRETLRDSLEQAGHTIMEAENGIEGLQALRETVPDLVITDVIMPEMEGIEMVVAIRNAYPYLPIVAISGGGRQLGPKDFLEVAGEIGANRTLSKPFSPDELVRAVEETLLPENQASPRIS